MQFNLIIQLRNPGRDQLNKLFNNYEGEGVKWSAKKLVSKKEEMAKLKNIKTLSWKVQLELSGKVSEGKKKGRRYRYITFNMKRKI